jgi:hypothetical protein
MIDFWLVMMMIQSTDRWNWKFDDAKRVPSHWICPQRCVHLCIGEYCVCRFCPILFFPPTQPPEPMSNKWDSISAWIYRFVTVTYVLEACANGNAINRMREQLGSEVGSIVHSHILSSSLSGNSHYHPFLLFSCILAQEYTETSALETVVPSAIRDAPEKAPNPPPLLHETTPLIDKDGEDANLLSGDEESELVHSSSVFSLVDRLEMVKMAYMYFGRNGQIAFYVLLVVYLFGDLSIYVVSVPVTLQSVVGGFSIGPLHFDTDTVYYVYLFLFAIVIIPFVFFDFTKTRWLQYIAMVMRNVALVLYAIPSSFHSSITCMPHRCQRAYGRDLSFV